VSVITPALTGELQGALYLGGPASGPITGPPFTVYLTFEGHGVRVKIRGKAETDPSTGQITTTFDETPQLPFSELKLHLTGGSRATLANPSACGSYSAESDLTPWSSPFEADATPLSTPFAITGCGAPRFAPSFHAGTSSNQAGGYSPFSVTFSREDADEKLAGVTVKTPPGLLGSLAHVPLCGEPQAAQGTCGAASLIGELTAGAGPGPEPYFIKGGRVYLTGPYGGQPFGLSIDVSEKAGPFDLGSGPCDCEVVRASVGVDRHTAQLTVASQAIPTIKAGIPFQVKTVNVNINRPEFIFNPTSCEPMAITGSLSSTQGAVAQVASRFQVTNCAALGFKPAFTAATSAATSKGAGASLDVKVAGIPGQANVAKTTVVLPKQLPARLTTIQQACPEATFAANPASCPVASAIGIAIARTPILAAPVTGPVYLVSHGGAAFPDVIVILQGEGVTVDLIGAVNIKGDITTTSFTSVPDVPIGTFQLYLPEGPHSGLAANLPGKAKGSMCGQPLTMPTTITAQDGAVVQQNTRIAVTGCAKPRKAKTKRAKKARAAHAAGRRHGNGRGNR